MVNASTLQEPAVDDTQEPSAEVQDFVSGLQRYGALMTTITNDEGYQKRLDGLGRLMEEPPKPDQNNKYTLAGNDGSIASMQKAALKGDANAAAALQQASGRDPEKIAAEKRREEEAKRAAYELLDSMNDDLAELKQNADDWDKIAKTLRERGKIDVRDKEMHDVLIRQGIIDENDSLEDAQRKADQVTQEQADAAAAATRDEYEEKLDSAYEARAETGISQENYESLQRARAEMESRASSEQEAPLASAEESKMGTSSPPPLPGGLEF